MSDVAPEELHPNPENQEPPEAARLADAQPVGGYLVDGRVYAHPPDRPDRQRAELAAETEQRALTWQDKPYACSCDDGEFCGRSLLWHRVSLSNQRAWRRTVGKALGHPPIAESELNIGKLDDVNRRRVQFGDISTYITDVYAGHVAADEASLRAMGARGDGKDFLFELDANSDLFQRTGPRLRVLVRAEPPIALEGLLPHDWLHRYAELTEGVGKALAECGKAIAGLVEGFKARTDPETGELSPPAYIRAEDMPEKPPQVDGNDFGEPDAHWQTCPDVAVCWRNCTLSTGCRRGIEGPADVDTLRDDGEVF